MSLREQMELAVMACIGALSMPANQVDDELRKAVVRQAKRALEDSKIERYAEDEWDMQQCETCPARLPIEQMISHRDVYLCPKCSAEAYEAFHACSHEWKPALDEMGDPAKQCHQCGGLIRIEDEVKT